MVRRAHLVRKDGTHQAQPALARKTSTISELPHRRLCALPVSNPVLPPEIGAAQVRLASVIRELVRLGHQVEVLTAMPNYPTGHVFDGYRGKLWLEEDWEGVRVVRTWIYPAMGTGPKRLFNYFSFVLSALGGLLKVQKPDYIFVESPPLFLSLTGYLASRRFGVPFIFNIADLWPDSVRQLGLMKEGLCCAWPKVWRAGATARPTSSPR